MTLIVKPKEKPWQVLSLVYDNDFHHAVIRLGWTTTTQEHAEYLAYVWIDGTYTLHKWSYAPPNRWIEVNGVTEDVEQLFKDTLVKAQALAILKG